MTRVATLIVAIRFLIWSYSTISATVFILTVFALPLFVSLVVLRRSATFVLITCEILPLEPGLSGGGTGVGALELTLYVISETSIVHDFIVLKKIVTNEALMTSCAG